MTLADALDALLKVRPVGQHAREAYANGLALFSRLTGIETSETLEKADPVRITKRLVKAVEDGHNKPSTVRAALGTARAVARFLSDEGELERNPLGRVGKLPAARPPQDNVLQPGELGLILNELEKLKAYKSHAIFSILGLHGLRVSEMCAMSWGDIYTDDDGRLVMSFKGKGRDGGKIARIKLTEDGQASAQRWFHKAVGRKWEPDDPFVPDEDGNHLKRHFVHKLVVNVTRQLVGHTVTPHGLRATFISSIIQKRGIEYARQLARHENLAVTQRYSRWVVLDVDGEKR